MNKVCAGSKTVCFQNVYINKKSVTFVSNLVLAKSKSWALQLLNN